MKAVMLMFDSLNRHMLPNYGCDWTHLPNFRRLADRVVTFDRSYVCSMPCIPARREIHTGRPNFLHRSWGPLEPFDDSMPEILKQNGIYTHLVTDHYHYFEEGGGTYHTRYSSYEFFRGQEYDPCVPFLKDPPPPREPRVVGRVHRECEANRTALRSEADWPQAQTMHAGLEFLRQHHDADNWFLQIETFDPHEPFVSPRKYKDRYPYDPAQLRFDWPNYTPRDESDEDMAHARYEMAALMSMCDAYLGDVLDAFDRHHLWDDTLLMVCTDHGFLLGEHDGWAKCWMPFYEEIAHTPLFIWDPRCGKRGERRQSLVQTIDWAPTLLDFFGLAPTPDMLGKPLAATLADDTPVREAGIFGLFGGQVNVTDGRHVYMRAAAREDNGPLFHYTHMPTHMRHTFSVEEMRQATMAPPFQFTKGCPVMKIPGAWPRWQKEALTRQNLLYDLEADPGQTRPTKDPEVEARMLAHLRRLMEEAEAPEEQVQRLGL